MKNKKSFQLVDHNNDYRTQGINSVTLLATVISAATFFTPLSLWWLALSVPLHYIGFSLEIHKVPKR
jgi:hypothetical protein